ncbi:hypothetical protein [Azospirillum argentinense]
MSPVDQRITSLWSGLNIEQKRQMIKVMQRLIAARNEAAPNGSNREGAA